MDARTRAELTQALRRQRAALLKQFFDAEADLRSLAEDGEAELEERAQEERAARVLARLDDRSPDELVRPARFVPVGTEVVESIEEGLDYLAPDRPPSEEE